MQLPRPDRAAGAGGSRPRAGSVGVDGQRNPGHGANGRLGGGCDYHGLSGAVSGIALWKQIIMQRLYCFTNFRTQQRFFEPANSKYLYDISKSEVPSDAIMGSKVGDIASVNLDILSGVDRPFVFESSDSSLFLWRLTFSSSRVVNRAISIFSPRRGIIPKTRFFQNIYNFFLCIRFCKGKG